MFVCTHLTYTHIHMYTHAHACAHTHTLLCAYTHINTYTHTHTYTHTRVRTHTHTLIYSFTITQDTYIILLFTWFSVFNCSFTSCVAATISFNQPQYSIVEGNEPLKPLLVLSNPSSYDITIRVENINDNASGKLYTLQELWIWLSVKLCWCYCAGNNTDYDSGPYNVMFPAGSTSIPFDVSITNDNILESNETFSLNIISSSAPDRVSITSPRQSAMTIIDNDSKW